ncbi:hypothetical protein [Sphingomonas sp.]|uniref:hypothetical protein n=1 Tax=Sphingomonas sp. TaxID=28214 RepID=UPI0025DE085E|nr:hypothetical protein [Sphingomonas sp.]MBV9528895.1 hypothetical protein [Sphingomonas sp.]
MGEPSQEQIDETIANGIALQLSEEEILERLASLERLTDEELAELGVYPAEQRVPATLPPAPAFTPVPLRSRYDGWTAERQRAFIAALAETGCVSEACAEVGITPRSAYRLRHHPRADAFRKAWDHAQSLASPRLAALAWERAVHGVTDRLYRNGELVAERRRPSDRLLMWLLAHHNPTAYGWAAKPPATAPDRSFFVVEHARAELPPLLDQLGDVPAADCPVDEAVVVEEDWEGPLTRV